MGIVTDIHLDPLHITIDDVHLCKGSVHKWLSERKMGGLTGLLR